MDFRLLIIVFIVPACAIVTGLHVPSREGDRTQLGLVSDFVAIATSLFISLITDTQYMAITHKQ